MDKRETLYCINNFINEIHDDFEKSMFYIEKYSENFCENDLKLIRTVIEETIFLTILKTFFFAEEIFEEKMWEDKNGFNKGTN